MAGNWLKGALFRFGDRMFPGSQYNPRDRPMDAPTWGAGGQRRRADDLNVLLPGSGTLWRTGANYIYNHNGNPGGVTQGTFQHEPSA